MKILYYDCFAGISGDMNLGALIDIGVESGHLCRELDKLGIDGFELKVSREKKGGIEGTRAEVIIKDEYAAAELREHRNISSIRRIIKKSSLNEKIKNNSIRIFDALAAAEAKVHGIKIENVHFHEVGAVDSIVDIVGAAICIDFLRPDMIMSSSVELGSGTVKTRHGILPVPAPATAELMMGALIKIGGTPFEMTTPTGAAILKTFVNSYTDRFDSRIVKTGYGIGRRDTDIPNVLRVFICENNPEENDTDSVYENMIEANLDDMSPESCSFLMDQFFLAGASDVFFTPIIMKKSRPAFKISVLCPAGREKTLREILLLETTTFGIRSIQIKKTALKREFRKTRTRFGDVNVKSAYYHGKKVKSKLEFEEVQRIALKNNLSYNEAEILIKKDAGID
jgi:hypothetical protein